MKLNDRIDRRGFLRGAAWFGASAVMAGDLLPRFVQAQVTAGGAVAGGRTLFPDLAVAEGADPARNVLAAIDAVGGFSRFVKPGQTVAIKPNPIGRSLPEQAIHTHPAMVEAVVRGCVAAGAGRVIVLSRDERANMDANGTTAAVTNGGGELKVPQGADDYREILVPRGRVLRREMIARDLLDADIFINMPIAKHHAGSEVTLSMKNLMGVNLNPLYYHQTDLHQCIAEVASAVRPQLVIMDANNVLLTNGPGGPGEAIHPGKVIVGADPVAVDAFTTRAFFRDPGEIRHIRMAWELGLGEIDLAKLEVREFKV